MKGLLSRTIEWMTHPTYSDESLAEWGAFLVLVLIASFLWTTVVRQIE